MFFEKTYLLINLMPPRVLQLYTSRGYGCGFYNKFIVAEIKAHRSLCNCFNNTAIGKDKQIENRNCCCNEEDEYKNKCVSKLFRARS